MSQAQDQKFFRTYTLVVGVLAVMILVFFILAQLIGSDEDAYLEERAEVVAERTAPEGQVRIAGVMATAEQAPAPAAAVVTAAATDTAAAGGDETGKRVFSSLCFTCHGNIGGGGGLPNVPHFGDKAAWADRIAQGKPLLYERALNGFTGASGIPMAPKGGNPNLTDDEVRAAVDFIVSNSQ